MDEKESYVIEGWTAIWECYVGEREREWVGDCGVRQEVGICFVTSN